MISLQMKLQRYTIVRLSKSKINIVVNTRVLKLEFFCVIDRDITTLLSPIFTELDFSDFQKKNSRP